MHGLRYVGVALAASVLASGALAQPTAPTITPIRSVTSEHHDGIDSSCSGWTLSKVEDGGLLVCDSQTERIDLSAPGSVSEGLAEFSNAGVPDNMAASACQKAKVVEGTSSALEDVRLGFFFGGDVTDSTNGTVTVYLDNPFSSGSLVVQEKFWDGDSLESASHGGHCSVGIQETGFVEAGDTLIACVKGTWGSGAEVEVYKSSTDPCGSTNSCQFTDLGTAASEPDQLPKSVTESDCTTVPAVTTGGAAGIYALGLSSAQLAYDGDYAAWSYVETVEFTAILSEPSPETCVFGDTACDDVDLAATFANPDATPVSARIDCDDSDGVNFDVPDAQASSASSPISLSDACDYGEESVGSYTVSLRASDGSSLVQDSQVFAVTSPSWLVSDVSLSPTGCSPPGDASCDNVDLEGTASGTASGSITWEAKCRASDPFAAKASCDGSTTCSLTDECDYSGESSGTVEASMRSTRGGTSTGDGSSTFSVGSVPSGGAPASRSEVGVQAAIANGDADPGWPLQTLSSYSFTGASDTLENAKVTGAVECHGSGDYTLRYVEVDADVRFPVDFATFGTTSDCQGASLTIEWSTLTGGRSATVINFGGDTVIRKSILEHGVDGLKLGGAGHLIEDNWFGPHRKDHFSNKPECEGMGGSTCCSHPDGVQIRQGQNIVFRRNHINGHTEPSLVHSLCITDGHGTSSMINQAKDAAIQNFTILGNFFTGGIYQTYFTNPKSFGFTNLESRENTWDEGDFREGYTDFGGFSGACVWESSNQTSSGALLTGAGSCQATGNLWDESVVRGVSGDLQ